MTSKPSGGGALPRVFAWERRRARDRLRDADLTAGLNFAVSSRHFESRALTCTATWFYPHGMGFARRVLVVLLAVALAGWLLNCEGMTSPEQAMQCCQSMQCHSHGHHSQDCCKTMPSLHPAFCQTASGDGVSFSPIALGPVTAFDPWSNFVSASRIVAEHAHAPPAPEPATPLPLRI